MDRRAFLLMPCAALAGCAAPAAERDAGWVTLIDGERGLENFVRLGEAAWRPEGGAIVAVRGAPGLLLTRQSYRDFELLAEFHAEPDTNSGILIRIANPADISPLTSYEVNIWDARPDPSFGTGAIVGFAKVPVPPVHRAGGRWNTLEVRAQGSSLAVKLNGVETASLDDSRFREGPIALQYGPGVNDAVGGAIRWRRLRVRRL